MNDRFSLGGRHFAIRPLRLGQLRHVLDALDEMTGKSGGGLIEAAAKVVAAGVVATHPEVTLERVLDLEATVEELNGAVGTILQVAGLRPRENADQESALGEAPPVASPLPGPGNS